MKTLHEIAQSQECDKADSMHTFKGETYIHVYERLFGRLRDRDINLLELGVWQGKSIRMWREYFKNAKIVGVDINPESLNYTATGCDIQIMSQDDQVKLTALSDKYEGWDIVIDDASHLNQLTAKSFKILWPTVKSGGLYIIEDLKVSHEDLTYTPNNWNGVHMHPQVQSRNNNRALLNEIFLNHIRGLDFGSGDVRSVRFYHQMAILEKI